MASNRHAAVLAHDALDHMDSAVKRVEHCLQHQAALAKEILQTEIERLAGQESVTGDPDALAELSPRDRRLRRERRKRILFPEGWDRDRLESLRQLVPRRKLEEEDDGLSVCSVVTPRTELASPELAPLRRLNSAPTKGPGGSRPQEGLASPSMLSSPTTGGVSVQTEDLPSGVADGINISRLEAEVLKLRELKEAAESKERQLEAKVAALESQVTEMRILVCRKPTAVAVAAAIASLTASAATSAASAIYTRKAEPPGSPRLQPLQIVPPLKLSGLQRRASAASSLASPKAITSPALSARQAATVAKKKAEIRPDSSRTPKAKPKADAKRGIRLAKYTPRAGEMHSPRAEIPATPQRAVSPVDDRMPETPSSQGDFLRLRETEGRAKKQISQLEKELRTEREAMSSLQDELHRLLNVEYPESTPSWPITEMLKSRSEGSLISGHSGSMRPLSALPSFSMHSVEGSTTSEVQLEEQLQLSRLEIAKLQARCQSDQAEIRLLRTNLDEARARDVVAERVALAEALQEAQASAASARREVQSLLEAQVEQRHEHESVLRAVKEAHSAEVASLQKQIDNNRETYSTSSQQLGTLAAEIETLQARLKVLNNEKARTEEERDALASQLSNQSAEVARLKHAREQLQESETALASLQSEIATAKKDAETFQAITADHKQQLQLVQEKYRREYLERRKLWNSLQEARGNIRVYCRVRPLLRAERAKNLAFNPTYPDTNELVLSELKTGTASQYLKQHTFEFEKVFSHEDCQQAVFEEVRELATSVMDGYNVCIFAYGQTGSGKTFTMEGSAADFGINQRILDELFRVQETRQDIWRYVISVSVVEIYNECVFDLLTDARDPREKKLEIRLSKEGRVTIPDAQVIVVDDAQQVLQVLRKGQRNRSVGQTDMNEHSSRSHCILSVYIDGRNEHANEQILSKLHLVDLAGSERVTKSHVVGDRLAEAVSINRSLSSLGDTIAALANKDKYVPYRNSQLTYFLSDSLAGDSKCLMFVTISPCDSDVPESINSLNFASRVRRVQLGRAKKHVTRLQ